MKYVIEEEEKGKQFVEIQEIIDDFTAYAGVRNYVCGNGNIARLFNNPKMIRIISVIWLMSCILVPVFTLWESYKSYRFVSFQIVAFCAMWIFVVLVPFFKYHFVDKNRGDN